MHLLVIEDERALCETIVRSLRRLAYSVDYCYDGEKALELLGVECYDLVLLDLNLPKKDGMTVLRALRQTDRETRVLILSARSEVEDKVQGLDAGERLSCKALSSCRAGGPHPQPDIEAVHPAGCAAKLRKLELRHPLPHRRRQWADADVDPKGNGDTRIPDGASGAARESRGADGSRLGQQRGRLQQFHSRPHLRPAQKAPRRAGL